MKFRPISAVTDLNGRKIYGVEVYIIFTHELVKVDVLGVKPPLFPFWGIVGCDAGVTNGSIKLQK
jgi:hypothetical protein